MAYRSTKQLFQITAAVSKWHLGHADAKYLPGARGLPLREEGYAADLIAAEACRIVEDHNPSVPLFLYVPFTAVHTPLEVPNEELAAYEHFKFKTRQTFAAVTTRMDRCIGKVLDSVDQRLDARQTLIVFCGDNGGIQTLGSNGKLRGGKGMVYEGGIRVPAIVRWQGVTKLGTRIDTPLHIVDWFPTLINLSGQSIDSAEKLDGRDLLPICRPQVVREVTNDDR
ncbi:MAG: sulfatase-like hydrolase/transferase [Planctomycetota bacterium]